MATFEDKVPDHDVDGIREYDNPLPGWLMSIWWGSLVFAILRPFSPDAFSAKYLAEALLHSLWAGQTRSP